VSPVQSLRTWWQVQTGEEDTPFDGDSTAFFASLIFHLCLLVIMGLVPFILPERQISLTVATPVEEFDEEELTLPEEFASSPQVQEEIGANSVGSVQMAMSLAPVISDVSVVPSPLDMSPTVDGTIEINNEIQIATGLNFSDNLTVKGATGVGVSGASGAIDRLTEEILRSLEERKTLVVWMFDQSGSLAPQRRAIHDRFDRIYEELGVIEAADNPAFADHDDKPLLTSIMAFGQNVTLLTKQPTDNLAEIKQAVASIQQDDTGEERIFSSVYMAADRYKQYRMRDPVHDEPDRNVMLIVFSDERGDDFDGLETTIDICRRYRMPVYVVGVPAPFGREESLIKWVDPNPEYDQTPQWGLVNQGPETLLPERVKLEFSAAQEDPDPMDSGFGPFALTRLCYETGGIYFAVHPNRNVHRAVSEGEVAAFSSHLKYFFDPQIMRRYRPDYVSPEEYMHRARSNQARTALLMAAKKSWVSGLQPPREKFIRRSDADFANQLNKAQAEAANLEPVLADMVNTLKAGEADRQRETTPRWQAGYDLAMGRVLATLVRARSYNRLLALARTGGAFTDPGNNTLILGPSDELPEDPSLAGQAEEARRYLERVVQEHPDTPWALLARRELDAPCSWTWIEQFTDLTPRPRVGVGDGRGGDGGGGRAVAPAAVEDRPAKRKPPRL
jgi:hypothetical protein